MGGWVEYWNTDSPIYVSARHKDVHFRTIAEDIAALVPEGAAVLDYGCGDARHADIVARRARTLLLADSAPNVRARLAEAFAGNGAIAIASPEEVAAIDGPAFDLIIVNSLAQYLSRADLVALLALWRRLLKPGGRLVLADILPKDLSALTDAFALLRFGAAHGFFIAAVLGLVRTAFSDYRKLRAELGLARYEESEILALMTEAGFSARRMARNLGHNQARMAFEGQG